MPPPARTRQAFTGGKGVDRRAEMLLSLVVDVEEAKKGPVVFYLEMACNGMFGNDPSGGIKAPQENRTFPVRPAPRTARPRRGL